MGSALDTYGFTLSKMGQDNAEECRFAERSKVTLLQFHDGVAANNFAETLKLGDRNPFVTG
jgi:hypothetical protein